MPSRITFVLPNLALAGGTKIAVLYAEQLAERGHQVTIVHGQLHSKIERVAQRLLPGASYEVRPKPTVRCISVKGSIASFDSYFPDADVIIGTWWETVEAINRASPEKGKKVHFVQGHEVWDYLPSRSADVYRLPIQKIVVSRWLQDVMRDVYGFQDASLVANPVNTDRFSWADRQPGANFTVGTVYSTVPVKDSALAFAAVTKARLSLPQLEMVCFGTERLPSQFNRPYVRYVRNPAQANIPELYRACDCWLFTSTEEGFGLPILEAMSVGTPVVATPAGAAPDLISERTGVLVDHNAAEMASAIVNLHGRSQSEKQAMSEACRATAERHCIAAAVDKFEAIVTGKER